MHGINETDKEIGKDDRTKVGQLARDRIECGRIRRNMLSLMLGRKGAVQLEQCPVSAIGHARQWLKNPDCQQHQHDG